MLDDLRAATGDLQRYLSDQIPPLTAADAVETFMGQPPELLMKQIQAWAVEQSRVQQAAMSDFLFHALRKVYLISHLKLVDAGSMDKYLNGVIQLAMQACPADERETLRTYIAAMREMQDVATAVVPIGAGTGPKPAAAAPPPKEGEGSGLLARSARRLGLVIDRLSKQFSGKPTPAPAAALPQAGAIAELPVEEPIAQLVSMAAASSSSDEELREYMQTLRPYTGGAEPDALFKVLAESLPQWDIPLPPAAESHSVQAMHKILSLTRSTTESMKRFRELLASAIEQFNAGALPAAVAMLDLGSTVILEKRLDPSTVDRIRAEVVESISAEQLRKYAENKTKHVLLRKALAFFPTLTTERLLEELRGEQRPERRRSLLGLLEAWGNEAREASLGDLEKELARKPEEVDTYYLRNLIYLLHRISRESDAGADKELELLTRASGRGQSIYVIKEAVVPLGQLKSDAAVKLLTTRLAEFEVALLRKDTSLYPFDEMQKLLDRICTALGRIATPAALLTIARHGMKPNPLLGDTRARLTALSQHDLSFDEQTVTIIVKAIREDLPAKILGRYITKQRQPPMKLIEALSSTRSEAVEKLFTEIADKFSDHELGVAASAALEKLASAGRAAAAPTNASLTGDLQFFGLPALLQSLADTSASGIVTLMSRQRQTAGKLLFVEGKFADAQTGNLRGVEALYQLLERPVVGTFAFVPQPDAGARTKATPHEIMSLLFEGIRRHDELKLHSVVVPDDMTLKAAGRPTPDPEEKDPTVIREVWVKASSGAPVKQWEPEIPVDAFRVRRLVARWVEEGALQPA